MHAGPEDSSACCFNSTATGASQRAFPRHPLSISHYPAACYMSSEVHVCMGGWSCRTQRGMAGQEGAQMMQGDARCAKRMPQHFVENEEQSRIALNVRSTLSAL